jgi:predicted ATP-grasp superfamily ATP-dependent carboligase
MTVSCYDAVVEDQSIRLLQSLGYHGLVGVEWKLDPRTGKHKLIEINARGVNTMALAGACGVDLPYIAFRDKTGLPQEPLKDWQVGVKWINIVHDIWAARALHRLGRLSLREWLKSIAGQKVDAVYAADDPRPFVGYFFEFLGSLNLVPNFGKLIRRGASYAALPFEIGRRRIIAALRSRSG